MSTMKVAITLTIAMKPVQLCKPGHRWRRSLSEPIRAHKGRETDEGKSTCVDRLVYRLYDHKTMYTFNYGHVMTCVYMS